MTSRTAPVLSIAVAALLLTGCGIGAAPSLSISPSPSAPPVASYEEFATRLCRAFQALTRAVGNPDSGEGSEVSDALERAATDRDPTAAAQAAAQIIGELEIARDHAAAIAGWPPGAAVGQNFDRLALAFQAWAAAGVDQARGVAASDPQQAFEAAGGLQAWTGMLEGVRDAGSERPAGPPRECEGVPISL